MFPPLVASSTLILDGKAVPLKRFSSKDAATLYLPDVYTRRDYMCFKHKPARASLLIQVLHSMIMYTN